MAHYHTFFYEVAQFIEIHNFLFYYSGSVSDKSDLGKNLRTNNYLRLIHYPTHTCNEQSDSYQPDNDF